MEAIGTPAHHAEMFACNLVEADYRGHYSHGMNRLGVYVERIEAGRINVAAIPAVIKETPATAWIDGQNGLGVVVGNFCMELAIRKAKSVGVGWVCVKASNHYGIAGFYAMQAQKQGLLGLSFTNTSKTVCPTRAKAGAIGTNPISLAAPACNGDGFVLDMATSAVAFGKIEMERRKGNQIPTGWALDNTGEMTTDPKIACESLCLLPLGGDEINSGYKGYGLALLVEIFCGILGGAEYFPTRNLAATTTVDKSEQCFIAVDPNCFAPGFESRLSILLQYLREMEPVRH